MIIGNHLNGGGKAPGAFLGPGYADGALWLAVLSVDAIGLMHGYAAPARDIAHNVVARHGIAAASEAHQHAAAALHIDALRGLAGAGGGALPHLGQGRRRLGRGGLLSLLLLLIQAGNHIGGGDHAVAHRAVDILRIGEGVLFQQRFQVFILHQHAQLQAAPLGLAIQQILALGHVLAAQLALEILADLRTRALSLDNLKPVHAGALGGGGSHDLHPVTRFQRGIQRHDTAVHLGANAAVAHGGMHAVGKVQRGRAAGHIDDIALGGKDEYLLGEDIGLQAVNKLMAVASFALPVQDLPQPVQLAIKGLVVAALLIAPVRGDAVLGHMVHFPGADLNFKGEGNAPAADHRGVQRLVHIVFGYRNIILEAAGHLRPQRMAHAQHRVTIRHGIHQHADGDQIVNLIEGLILNHHFAVDAVQMLGAARHFKMHAQVLELLGQFLNDDFDVFLALGALHAHLARHILIALGIDIAQRQIF